MKTLATILVFACLASCASKLPPRALLPHETVVRAVDTSPVETSARAVSDGTERVIEANRKAREANNKAVDTTVRLRAAMDRARVLAAGQDLLKQAWNETERFAVQLGNELIETQVALGLSKVETDGLRESVKSLADEISTLKASAAVNKVASDTLRAENIVLRKIAEQANAARDDLLTLKATSKTTIARQRKLIYRLGALAALTTGASIMLGYLLFKP